MGWNEADTGHWFVTILDSKLVPQKVDMLPLLLAGRGMTLRIDMRSDANHWVPGVGWAGATYSNVGTEDYADAWFKFTNVKLYTIEIVPSNEFKQQLVQLLESKG